MQYDEETTTWPATDEEGRRRRKRTPTYVIYYPPHPEVYEVERGAPNRTVGVPELHTLAPGGQKEANDRRKVIRALNKIPTEREGSKIQYHETPGMRTLESLLISDKYGNWGPVPKSENASEAGRRSGFYRRNKLNSGDRYLHVVAPKELEDFIAKRRKKRK